MNLLKKIFSKNEKKENVELLVNPRVDEILNLKKAFVPNIEKMSIEQISAAFGINKAMEEAKRRGII